VLALEHIAVDHGKLRAIWDVSLHVGRGERVGLLGANGAGKSTTMGAVAGLYRASAGAIRLDGELLEADSRQVVERGVALVPEGRRLFPGMTVLENLLMGAFVPGKRRGSTAALEAVFALFPVLHEKRRQAAGHLSGGQQQMVAIGRALMSSPRVLLLDEPFIGVAPKLVDTLLEALRRIAGGGVTMVLVEQNIHRALDFVERAYVLENGRVVLEGSREAILGDAEFSNKVLGLE